MQPIVLNYNLASYGKQLWSASTQAAQAVSVGLATTYTGLCLSNPNKSNANLYLLRVGLALSAAPAATASFGIIGGISTTDVAHTTPGTVASTFLGYAGPHTGLVDTAATIPTPTWLEQLMGGFTVATLPSSPLSIFDFQGSWVIPPGGFIAVGALTAASGLWSMVWFEGPLNG